MRDHVAHVAVCEALGVIIAACDKLDDVLGRRAAEERGGRDAAPPRTAPAGGRAMLPAGAALLRTDAADAAAAIGATDTEGSQKPPSVAHDVAKPVRCRPHGERLQERAAQRSECGEQPRRGGHVQGEGESTDGVCVSGPP